MNGCQLTLVGVEVASLSVSNRAKVTLEGVQIRGHLEVSNSSSVRARELQVGGWMRVFNESEVRIEGGDSVVAGKADVFNDATLWAEGVEFEGGLTLGTEQWVVLDRVSVAERFEHRDETVLVLRSPVLPGKPERGENVHFVDRNAPSLEPMLKHGLARRQERQQQVARARGAKEAVAVATGELCRSLERCGREPGAASGTARVEVRFGERGVVKGARVKFAEEGRGARVAEEPERCLRSAVGALKKNEPLATRALTCRFRVAKDGDVRVVRRLEARSR